MTTYFLINNPTANSTTTTTNNNNNNKTKETSSPQSKMIYHQQQRSKDKLSPSDNKKDEKQQQSSLNTKLPDLISNTKPLLTRPAFNYRSPFDFIGINNGPFGRVPPSPNTAFGVLGSLFPPYQSCSCRSGRFYLS